MNLNLLELTNLSNNPPSKKNRDWRDLLKSRASAALAEHPGLLATHKRSQPSVTPFQGTQHPLLDFRGGCAYIRGGNTYMYYSYTLSEKEAEEMAQQIRVNTLLQSILSSTSIRQFTIGPGTQCLLLASICSM